MYVPAHLFQKVMNQSYSYFFLPLFSSLECINFLKKTYKTSSRILLQMYCSLEVYLVGKTTLEVIKTIFLSQIKFSLEEHKDKFGPPIF